MKKYTKSIILFLLTVLVLAACSPVNRYIRRAGKNVENGNLVAAKQWYLKALQKDPDNYKANLGLGITLAEFMDKYEEGLPYLQKALAKSPKDTFVDLFFATGKCHEHLGEYEKALSFYNRLDNVVALADDNAAFQQELKKRKEDCKYGITHPDYTPPKNWYVVNAGKGINTEMPEYVPVITPNNDLIYTSKRQDTKNETINYLDGKYFESMYVSSIDASGYYKSSRRYTLPDLFAKSKFKKRHESIVSMSPDGKKLFVYRDTKIYEIDMDQRQKIEPKKLSKAVNFDFYQNHAYLSADGQTLFFTSESDKGLGGNDIYMAKKLGEGVWDKPQNLGATINTEYDEDAPFMSNDGKTFYFASKGHEGFGGFDIYKSIYENGTWSKPENLGKPVNSPAHDIFLVQNKADDIGYFSSARKGGQGDMDIYKINYVKDFNLPCTPNQDNNMVQLSESTINSDETQKRLEVKLNSNYTVLAYKWYKNFEEITKDSASILLNCKPNQVYTIEAKVIAACDTCFQPFVGCKTLTLQINTGASPTLTNEPTVIGDITSMKGRLTDEQLKALGFNVNPVLFDFNAYNLREDALAILANNKEVLKKYPTLRLEINGYTDQRGSEAYNKQLSANRANAVKNYFVKQGIAKKQVPTKKAFGKSNFVYDCSQQTCDDAMHQANRRVVFYVFNEN